MASVAVGAGELQPAAAATVRQEMQNWVSFPNFLLPDHWVCWQSNERQLHKLETVVNHLIRMGLRHPSERTQATLAAIVSHVGPNAMDPFAAPDVPRQTALLSTVKAVCKTQLLRLRNVGLPMPGGYIIELPASVQDLPLALRNEMFPGGGVPPPMDVNPIWQVAQAWAVRSTHRPRTMGQSNLMGAASASDAASIAAQAALSTVLALAPHVAGAHGSVSDAVPGLQIFGGVNRATSAAASGSRTEFGALLDRASAGNADSATPTVTPALALEDRPHAAVESVVGAQQTVDQPPDAAVQSTPALQTEVADAQPDLEMNLAALADAHYNCSLPALPASPGKHGEKMRRPAAAAKKMRRPAAAPHAAPSTKLKRPAAAVKSLACGRTVAIKKRPATAASTTKSVTRSQAKRLRPDGCGKCRYQCGCTPSCWRKDGITLLDD